MRYIDELVYYQIDADNDEDFADDGEGHYAITDRNFSVIGVEAGGVGSGEFERARYSAYGETFGMPFGDVDADGDADTADTTAITAVIGNSLGGASYQVEADIDLDGSITTTDRNAASTATHGAGVLSGAGNIVGYAGYLYEEATGMYLARHRWYVPELGRWANRDPALYEGGDNLYEYVYGSPITSVDPDGDIPILIIGAAVVTVYILWPDANEMNSMSLEEDMNRRTLLAMANPVIGVPFVIGGVAECVCQGEFGLAGELVAGEVVGAAIPVVGKPIGRRAGRVAGRAFRWIGTPGRWVGRKVHELWDSTRGAKSRKEMAKPLPDIPSPNAKCEKYNREAHYGKTPTRSDREALGAGSDEVVDHDPPLVERYYSREYMMTPDARRRSAGDRGRMKLQPKDASNRQGGRLSHWSRKIWKWLTDPDRKGPAPPAPSGD